MWWQVALVVLLVIGVAVGLTTGLIFADRNPRPSPSATPTPTVTPTPTIVIKTLFYDTFDGVTSLPLQDHVPNEPVGAGWLPATAYSAQQLTLNGEGQAVNSVDINSPTNPSIYQGANITSGSLEAAGYNPTTDTLEYTLTFEIPTGTLGANQDALFLLAGLSRTTPQTDYFMIQLFYTIGNLDTPTAPHYQFIARTILDDNGPLSNTQIIANSGVVSGSPPTGPIEVVFSIQPNGQCHVVCPRLSIDARGPTTPDLIPRDGAVMDYFWTFNQSIQDKTGSPPPLLIKLDEILVTATRPYGATASTGTSSSPQTSAVPHQHILQSIIEI